MYRPKRISRIRIRIGRRTRILAAAIAIILSVSILFLTLLDEYGSYESLARDRFQQTFDTVTAEVLSQYSWDESKLPEAASLASCKADILDSLRDEIKGTKLEFTSAEKLFGEGKSPFIKLPRIVSYSISASGYFKQDYHESGLNMGVYTITFVAEASVTTQGTVSQCMGECIVYRCFVEGEVPDLYFEDLFE